MINAKFLRKSGDTLVLLIINFSDSVKNIKLEIKPIIIPKYLFLFPPTPAANKIGKTGKMQGDVTVTKPANNENKSKNIMCSPLKI